MIDVNTMLTEVIRQLGIDYAPKYYKANDEFTLVKSAKNCKTELDIGIRDHQDRWCFHGTVVGKKSFLDVDKILSKYYVKYEIDRDIFTIFRISNQMKNSEKNPNSCILEKEDIENFVPILKKYVVEDVVGFLEKFNTVEDVYNYDKALSLEDGAKFLLHPQPIFRLIIRAICKDPDYELFSENLYKGLMTKSSDPNRQVYQRYLPELFEELKIIYLGFK